MTLRRLSVWWIRLCSISCWPGAPPSFNSPMIDARLIGNLIRWLITLALPFLLVAGSVRLLLSHEFLRLAYQRPGFPADPYGFTTEDRIEYGVLAIDFLFQSGDSSALAAQRIPRQKCWQLAEDASDCPLFNANELRHLEDVKHIVTIMFSLAVVCGSAVAAFLLASRSRSELQPHVRGGLRGGARFTLAAILTLAVVAAAAWDSAFDRFHELFFAAGTWRFPFSDSLIRLYPEQLFVDASLLIGGFCALGAVLILLLTSRWRRRSQ